MTCSRCPAFCAWSATDDGVERVMMYEWHLPGGDTDQKGGES